MFVCSPEFVWAKNFDLSRCLLGVIVVSQEKKVREASFVTYKSFFTLSVLIFALYFTKLY